MVLSNPETVIPVRSQLVKIGRSMWSNCPYHGARIVATALNNPSLYQEWSVLQATPSVFEDIVI